MIIKANPSVQAARRTLDKRNVNWAENKPLPNEVTTVSSSNMGMKTPTNTITPITNKLLPNEPLQAIKPPSGSHGSMEQAN